MEIAKPIQWDDMHQIAFQLNGPSFKELLKVTEETIVFDGYFRYEPEMFRVDRPIYRLLYFHNHVYYIAFTEKRVGKDTSCYWDDEEACGKICLTPTELIELRYHVVEKDPSQDRMSELIDQIKKQEDLLRDENGELCSQRQKKEWEAMRNASFEEEDF
jgi:hypothetical protein